MSTALEKYILAILTTDIGRVGGGAPIFVFNTDEEIQQKMGLFESVLGGMVHRVDEGVFVVVRHH